jgi:Holliday junction DNA helicase RuvB
MEDYSVDELKELASRYAVQLNVSITDEAAEEITKRSQGSYRQLTKMMKRARDFATVKGNGVIDSDVLQANYSFDFFD